MDEEEGGDAVPGPLATRVAREGSQGPGARLSQVRRYTAPRHPPTQHKQARVLSPHTLCGRAAARASCALCAWPVQDGAPPGAAHGSGGAPMVVGTFSPSAGSPAAGAARRPPPQLVHHHHPAQLHATGQRAGPPQPGGGAPLLAHPLQLLPMHPNMGADPSRYPSLQPHAALPLAAQFAHLHPQLTSAPAGLFAGGPVGVEFHHAHHAAHLASLAAAHAAAPMPLAWDPSSCLVTPKVRGPHTVWP